MKIIIKEQKENATKIIQNALDEVFLAGGGTVEIEKGFYTIGSLRVRSNTTLYLKSGAVLKGTRNPEDYNILASDKVEPLCEADLKRVEWEFCPDTQTDNGTFSLPGTRWNHALIRTVDAYNVRIIGEKESVIDGANCYDALGEENYRGPHGISFFRSENVLCEGYTLQNTGNWAHIGTHSKNLTFRNITALKGHDGVHINGCDNVYVENCEFYTGDDCIAGYDNNNVVVTGCVLNTACSAMRFGGTNVLIEKCKIYGPAKNNFRFALSLEDKISGTDAPAPTRKNMLSIFTYYADFCYPIRNLPENIIIKDCVCKNVDRVVNYDYSGHNRWQCNRPLGSVSFENTQISEVRIPLFLYGEKDEHVKLSMKNCSIAFEEPIKELIYACNCKEISLSNVKVEGVKGKLVKSWGNLGTVKCENVSGVEIGVVETDEKWDFQVI